MWKSRLQVKTAKISNQLVFCSIWQWSITTHGNSINAFFFDGHAGSFSPLNFRDGMVNSDYEMNAAQTLVSCPEDCAAPGFVLAPHRGSYSFGIDSTSLQFLQQPLSCTI